MKTSTARANLASTARASFRGTKAPAIAPVLTYTPAQAPKAPAVAQAPKAPAVAQAPKAPAPKQAPDKVLRLLTPEGAHHAIVAFAYEKLTHTATNRLRIFKNLEDAQAPSARI